MRPRLARALVASLAALTLHCARAEAANSNAAGSGHLLLEVELNQRPLGLLGDFQMDSQGRLSATAAELASLGFEPARLPAQGGQVHLDQVAGLSYVYDEAGQRISITSAPQLMHETSVDANPGLAAIALSQPATGALLNYDLLVNGASQDPLNPIVAAQLDGRVFGRFGVLSSSVIANAAPRDGLHVVRLDTNWVIESPRHMATLLVGDSIQSALSWTRPIRFAGLQISRRFEMRPDLIRMPLPVLRGTAETPSTLDLYVDGAHRLTTQVPSGPFAVRYAPGGLGAGVSDIIVRDVLGRETQIDLPFYTTDTLLAPGLLDFSFEAGFARRDFGIASADYDPHAVGSASIRYSLTPALTLQMHGEGASHLLNMGGGGVFTLGHLAVASVSAAASASRRGTGLLVDVSLETRRGPFALNIRSTRSFGAYEDLASLTSTQGDPQLSRSFAPPKVVEQAQLSGRLWSRDAVFSISYAHIERADGSQRLASATFTQRIGNASLYLRASQDFGGSQGHNVAVGFSLPLGRLFSSSQVVEDQGRVAATSEVSSRPVSVPGDVSWRARVAEGFVRDRSAAVTWMLPFGRMEAGVQENSSGVGVSLHAAGGLAFVDGALFASRRIDDAFAVVNLGLPSVPVSSENRLAGLTNSSGRLLIPNLAAYQPTHISIDATRIPVDQDMPVDSFIIAPRRGAAAILNVPRAPSVDAALLDLVDVSGAPLPPGGVGELNGVRGAFLVGYDGAAFVEGLGRQNVLRIDYPGGRSCVVSFPYQPARGRQVRVGPLRCSPLMVAQQ